MLSVAMHCWVTRWLVLSTRGASILQLHRGSSSSRSVSPASLPSGKQRARVRVTHAFSVQFTSPCPKPPISCSYCIQMSELAHKNITIFQQHHLYSDHGSKQSYNPCMFQNESLIVHRVQRNNFYCLNVKTTFSVLPLWDIENRVRGSKSTVNLPL